MVRIYLVVILRIGTMKLKNLVPLVLVIGKHLNVLANAASRYQKVLVENRKLYNQVQDLKGRTLLASVLKRWSGILFVE